MRWEKVAKRTKNKQTKKNREFPGISVIRLCASTAGGTHLIPGRGTKIPQKRWTNKTSQNNNKQRFGGWRTSFLLTSKEYAPKGPNHLLFIGWSREAEPRGDIRKNRNLWQWRQICWLQATTLSVALGPQEGAGVGGGCSSELWSPGLRGHPPIHFSRSQGTTIFTDI